MRSADDEMAGHTVLGDGSRVHKHHLRLQALGDVEELNAALGILLAEPIDEPLRAGLETVQHALFTLGGELSIPGFALLDGEALARLDLALARQGPAHGGLAGFVLPAGTRAAALAHWCRTLARRAERSLSALAADTPLRPLTLAYLDRLSDLLLGVARQLNRPPEGSGDEGDTYWSLDGLRGRRVARDGR